MEKYPEHVVVAGGGRWARVLVSVLCELLPESSTITVYSPHGAETMLDWAASQALVQPVSVSSAWPRFPPDRSHAMIVANAVRDHFRVARRALEARIPVLVEKPVTLSYAQTDSLVRLAQRNGVLFAPAHVFLFASHIEAFSKFVTQSGAPHSIRIRWSDPRAEERHGEKKSFDPSLPIYIDWIPHVLSVMSTFAPVADCGYEGIVLDRGGASLAVSMRLDDIPCVIELFRNGDLRERIVEVENESGLFQLDFSMEPGIAFRDSVPLPETLLFSACRTDRPVSSMLDAFLRCAVARSEPCDDRLESELGLMAARLSEQIAEDYEGEQKKWLHAAFSACDEMNDDIRYALAEILHVSGPCRSESVNQMIQAVVSTFAGPKQSGWLDKLEETEDYRALIRDAAEIL